MHLYTKFDLNQEAWAISNSNYGRYVSECSICDRTGRVTLNGEDLACPKCRGMSVVPRWFIEVKGGIIVRVETRQTVDRLAESEYDNGVTYRLNSVGDGIIWPENQLFSSEREAEAECKKRNGLLEVA